MLKNKTFERDIESVLRRYAVRNQTFISLKLENLTRWLSLFDTVKFNSKLQNVFTQTTKTKDQLLTSLEELKTVFTGEDTTTPEGTSSQWDYEIYVAINALIDRPCDSFLVHEQPLTEEQSNKIREIFGEFEVIHSNAIKLPFQL